MLTGWLFDAYPTGEGMAVWLIGEDGRAHRLVVPFAPIFYVAGPERLLARLPERLAGLGIAAETAMVAREDLASGAVLPVLQIAARSPLAFPSTVRAVARIRGLSPFDCDLSVPQLFFAQTGLFPLGRYQVEGGPSATVAEFQPLDTPEDLEYALPPLVTMRLRLDGDPTNPAHGRMAEIEASVDGETVVLCGDRPEDLIDSLNRLIGRHDPDVLLTEWGDAFLLPRLQTLAARVGMPLRWNRERGRGLRARRARSYVTYGQTVFTAGAQMLHGRWHLDLRNSFIYGESELVGLIEIARLACLPVQYLARTSIGTAISAMQIHRAIRRGVLVPWRKSEPEGFKSAGELLVTDKGGLTYQPVVGLFEGVGELDFASMYPTIMARFNISPETVNCTCCPDAPRVPETGARLCRRRRGLLPEVLDPLLARRAYYKRRRQETVGAERALYNQRQTALKWCLVCCMDGSTNVLHRINGRLRIAPIRDIVDAYLPGVAGEREPVDDLAVVGIDRELRSCVKSVKSVIKAPAPPKMIRMRSRWGRELLMTPNHRCYVLQDGRLQVKRADQLAVGDWIPLAVSMDRVATTEVSELNLVQALQKALPVEEQKRWRVFGRHVQRAVQRRYRAIVTRAHGEYTAKTTWNWSEYGYLPLHYIEPDDFASFERLSIGRGKLTGGLIQRLPCRVEVDEDLGFLLGFFVGDGSATRSSIRFDVGANEREHLVRLRTILRRKFWAKGRRYRERKAKMDVLQVNSVALVQVFKNVFGLEGSAARGKLRIPEVILNGSRDAQMGFVLGLIASDGSVSRTRNFACISSADRRFVNQLGLLFTLLGIDYRLTNSGRFHGIQTRNLEETLKVLREGAPVSDKHLRALRYRQFLAHTPRLPLNESSLIFGPVTSIEEVPYDERYVYCFQLAGEPTAFFAEGGVLTGNSFGYLGYRNARFGRIEAHEATTAFSREMLLRAKDLAEAQGYRMLHALVDSMWLHQSGATRADYDALALAIEETTGLPILVEGVYDWITFLPSRTHPGLGVPNRYLGRFDDGTNKVRGIELRRSDVPALIERTQARMLEVFFAAGTAEEVRAVIPQALDILTEAVVRLRGGEVRAADLAVTTTISRAPEEYRNNAAVAVAARQMARAGVSLHPGERIQYVITDAGARLPDDRVRPLGLLGPDWSCDMDYYTGQLMRAAETLLVPLGFPLARLKQEVRLRMQAGG